ncbi:MAG: glycogen synthase GlgA [Halothiobacillaceae bacterium]
MNILFVTSEAYPLIKTGGLADVSGALPRSLASLGQQVRVVLPMYADLALSEEPPVVATLEVSGQQVRLRETRLGDSDVPVWLVDHPMFSARHGNPYMGPDGNPWHDNPERFALFCRVAARLAIDDAGLAWTADIVHCNDWQSGLVPVLLSSQDRPSCIMTLHNLAYQGVFDRATFERLGLPWSLWHADALEYWGNMSMLKGGIVFSRFITAVSPTYAREIQTPTFGYGLDGLLQARASDVIGILNGIDERAWNPATDPHLVQGYDVDSLDGKRDNKAALQAELGLPVDDEVMLVGHIGRLVDQKGIDLLLGAIPRLMHLPLQFAILGSGESRHEHALRGLAARYPDKIGVFIGYDEALAHRIEAGSDWFVMPSRFEPCGLNQLYSLRYGTPPIVHKTGGLADTVVHADADTIREGRATGLVMEHLDRHAIEWAIGTALQYYHVSETYRGIQQAAMSRRFDWENSARQYIELYERSLSPEPPERDEPEQADH